MRALDGLRSAALFAGLLLLFACGPAASPSSVPTIDRPTPTAIPEMPIALEGTEWSLTALLREAPMAGASLKLAFYEDNYMEGEAGCNTFGVDYTTSGREFRVAQLHRTGFECEEPPGVMAADDAFFEALARVAAYRATEGTLEFDDAAGETVLAYARKLPAPVDPALSDTEWLLTSLSSASLLEDSRITLDLGAERFDGVAGCNNYGGEYGAADGGLLRLTEIYLTAMGCGSPPGIMEQEAAYIQALGNSAAYRLGDGRLEIADASGDTILVFARKTEYGTDPAALLRTAWRLVSSNGESLSEGSTATLVFYSSSILGGRAGCWDYVATYEARGDDLNVLFEVMLDAGCHGDASLEQETLVQDVLAPKADLRLGDEQLEVHGERGGVLVFEPLPEEAALDLEGTPWSLLAVVGPNPYAQEPEPWPMPDGLPAGIAIDITFKDDVAQGLAGCNRYGAAYSRAGSAMSFGGATVTEMACPAPEGIMEQEARYLEMLAAISSYQILGDRLWLETDDGRALVFRAP